MKALSWLSLFKSLFIVETLVNSEDLYFSGCWKPLWFCCWLTKKSHSSSVFLWAVGNLIKYWYFSIWRTLLCVKGVSDNRKAAEVTRILCNASENFGWLMFSLFLGVMWVMPKRGRKTSSVVWRCVEGLGYVSTGARACRLLDDIFEKCFECHLLKCTSSASSCQLRTLNWPDLAAKQLMCTRLISNYLQHSW